jgi:hypothetical protein
VCAQYGSRSIRQEDDSHIHKTDKLDAQDLATLEHLGSLPAIWIAPGEIRDSRELPRTRMTFSKMRTALTKDADMFGMIGVLLGDEVRVKDSVAAS